MNNWEALEQEIATLSAHLDAATHRLLECIRDFDESGGWADQGALSCAHWLTWRVGWDLGTARERVRVARALGKLPAIAAALHSGGLSYAKVRALTRVATPGNEALLLTIALFSTGAQLEQLCRGYRSVVEAGKTAPEERSVRRRLLPGGKVKLEMVLEADEADLVTRALDRAREVRAGQAAAAAHVPDAPSPQTPEASAGVPAETAWPSRADGMVQLAESFLAGNPVTGNGGERFQVVVHIDQDALGPDGALAGTLEDGTSVSAETLRRVACDCSLVGAHHDGQALNIGRRTRSIPPAIRRALRLRDNGCAFPGCTHTRFLHAHHIQHWLHGGETSLQNCVLTCTFHHHLLHEGGWRVTVDADGTFQFHPPVGNPLARISRRERVGDGVIWLREWAEANELVITAEVSAPRWDGKWPDYTNAVGALLEAG
jgi:hypothetical protein